MSDNATFQGVTSAPVTITAHCGATGCNRTTTTNAACRDAARILTLFALAEGWTIKTKPARMWLCPKCAGNFQQALSALCGVVGDAPDEA
jgi:hypothetical protein